MPTAAAVPTLYDINGSADSSINVDFGLVIEREPDVVRVHVQKVKFRSWALPAWFRLCTNTSTAATRLVWRIWRLIKPVFASPISRSTPIAGYRRGAGGVVLGAGRFKYGDFCR
jgi:hypothetical protein